MKTYTDKTDRINSQKCLFAAIRKGSKARKTANRRTAKKDIIKILNS